MKSAARKTKCLTSTLGAWITFTRKAQEWRRSEDNEKLRRHVIRGFVRKLRSRSESLALVFGQWKRLKVLLIGMLGRNEALQQSVAFNRWRNLASHAIDLDLCGDDLSPPKVDTPAVTTKPPADMVAPSAVTTRPVLSVSLSDM